MTDDARFAAYAAGVYSARHAASRAARVLVRAYGLRHLEAVAAALSVGSLDHYIEDTAALFGALAAATSAGVTGR
jgi:hypothetical protein